MMMRISSAGEWVLAFILGVGIMVAGALIVFALTAAAHAHSWYPLECCSERDCAVYGADTVRETPSGYVLHDGVTVAYGKARHSPDGKFHRCSRPDGSLICFFAPVGGS